MKIKIFRSIEEFNRATVTRKLNSSITNLTLATFPVLTLQNSFRLRKSLVDSIAESQPSDAETIEQAIFRLYITGEQVAHRNISYINIAFFSSWMRKC